MSKLSLLSAALGKGHIVLVVIAVVNTAIAIYYYLSMIREAYFRDPAASQSPIRLDWSTRAVCVLLMAGILALGVAPARVIGTISTSIAYVNKPLSNATPKAITHTPTNAPARTAMGAF